MGALTVDPGPGRAHGWDDLVRLWEETDWPEGCKVEITSPSNARHDRISEAAGYARAGVPLYLMVDRWAPGGPTVTLYGEP
ncbi:hypothetical protein GCM10010420_21590 [Streptomyces glaucosporus]|uniref:Restriction endonuclease domain-containing protein n=1 Tax=Streptomyces glaucosporus TaxID=284044 RepID=A0ABN3I737_9ACTN